MRHRFFLKEYESKFSSEIKKMHPRIYQLKAFPFQWNQCKFYCIMCSKFYNCQDSFKLHSKLEHGLKMSEVIDHKQSTDRKHHCFICRVVRFDRAPALLKHLKVIHKMSIKDYEEKCYSERRAIFDLMSDGQILQPFYFSLSLVKYIIIFKLLYWLT